MSRITTSCEQCGTTVTRQPSWIKQHVFCSPACFHQFRSAKVDQRRALMPEPPRRPTLPYELYEGNRRKLSDEQIELGRSLLESGHSQRFTASKLGVSRHVLRMWCVPGFKEQWWARYGEKHRALVREGRDLARARETSRRYYRRVSAADPGAYAESQKKRNDFHRPVIREAQRRWRAKKTSDQQSSTAAQDQPVGYNFELSPNDVRQTCARPGDGLTIYANGFFRATAEFGRKYDPQKGLRAVLYWDIANKAIAIGFTNAQESGTIPLSFSGMSRNARIHAPSFFQSTTFDPSSTSDCMYYILRS